MTYIQKLRDPRWQKKRLRIFERDGWKCTRCGADDVTLNVHHISYVKDGEPWETPDDLLLTLCEDCHKDESKQCRIQSKRLLNACKNCFSSYEMHMLSIVLEQWMNLDFRIRGNGRWFIENIHEIVSNESIFEELTQKLHQVSQ